MTGDVFTPIELVCVITGSSSGSKILKFARSRGITGGTIIPAKGTVKNRVLELLDLNDVRKEIVLMAADEATAEAAISEMKEIFAFEKPNHGIAFTIPLTRLFGIHKFGNIKHDGGTYDMKYDAIYTIVDKGRAEEVVEAAKRAGARGGTIINARGCGIHENAKLFSVEIEPEKEMVLIITKKELTSAITEAISDALHINEPGKGIIFVNEVNNVCGLY